MSSNRYTEDLLLLGSKTWTTGWNGPVSDSSNGVRVWVAYWKSEALQCHICRPCFLVGDESGSCRGDWVSSLRWAGLLPAGTVPLCAVQAAQEVTQQLSIVLCSCWFPSSLPRGVRLFSTKLLMGFLLLQVLWGRRFLVRAWSGWPHRLFGELTHVNATFKSCLNN